MENTKDKLWETEYFTLNFITGELERVISPHYFEAIGFEAAQKSLIESGLQWIRLTGKWFKDHGDAAKAYSKAHYEQEDSKQEEIEEVTKAYETIVKPSIIVEDMTLDKFLDWLNISDELEDILATLRDFRKDGLTEHVKVILGHLRHKYGYTEDEKGLQRPD